jgi:hypothetical protein
MSIPSYQFASLQMENDAKKRVMKRAKKGFETEEQRAFKSGRIESSIKNVYNTISANLEMQRTTIVVAEAFIQSVAYSAVVEHGPAVRYEDDAGVGEGEMVNMGTQTERADIAKENSLGSYIFASLGKLVALASQLVMLVKKLGDEVIATGKPATPSIGVSKIISTMDEINSLYGEWGESGLAKSISVMATALRNSGNYPPQLDGLLHLWNENRTEARNMLERIQANQYNNSLESINIPSKTTNAVRRANIARGEEKRDFTKSEYELLLELRKQGFLTGDDFTSVYSGEGDDSTISTYGTLSSASSSDDDDDSGYADARRRARRDADRNVFGRVPDSDDESSVRSGSSGTSYYADLRSIPRAETVYRDYSNYFDNDDSTISSRGSSGSGLYTLPFGRSGVPMRLL